MEENKEEIKFNNISDFLGYTIDNYQKMYGPYKKNFNRSTDLLDKYKAIVSENKIKEIFIEQQTAKYRDAANKAKSDKARAKAEKAIEEYENETLKDFKKKLKDFHNDEIKRWLLGESGENRDEILEKIKDNSIDNLSEEQIELLNPSKIKDYQDCTNAAKRAYQGWRWTVARNNENPNSAEKFFDNFLKNTKYADLVDYVSLGQGTLSSTPFVVFKKEGTNTEWGVYVVYLFDKTEKQVYLTLSLGSENIYIEKNKALPISTIGLKDEDIEELIKDGSFVTNVDEGLNLHDKAKFEQGVILYKTYERNELDNATLEKDLLLLLELYNARDFRQYQISKAGKKGNNKETSEKNNPSLNGYKDTLEKNKAMILYGPPGTGKTRLAKMLADDITDKDKVKLVQFHPNYSYNDFIETLDFENKNYKNSLFIDFAEKAIKDKSDSKYVLIVDEINRANVSEIFGELLYGLEYREKKFSTSLSGQEKEIPNNVYIIGTMNTADRSLESLDYAIRRRFSFVLVSSAPPEIDESGKNNKEDYYLVKGQSKYFLKNLHEKVREDISSVISRDVLLDDIMPGVSYFLINENSDKNGYDLEHAKYKVEYELIPLMQEYAKNGFFTNRVKLKDVSGKEATISEMLRGKIVDSAYYKKMISIIEKTTPRGNDE